MRDYLSNPGAMNVPLLDSPFFEQVLPSLGLDAETEASIRKFHRDGYLILESGVTDDAAIERILSDLDGKYTDSPTGYPGKGGRRMDAWKFSEAVKGLAISDSVVKLLRALYQREPIPFQTLNFEVGTQQRAHSDTIHFHSVPHGFMCGVWVALEDIDAENGPLFYYPGSHTLPYYDMFDIGLPSEWNEYQGYEDFIESLIESQSFERKEVHIKRGQAIVWSANVLHGGCQILDQNRTRKSQVTHYVFEDCLYYQPCVSEPYLGRMKLKEIINLRDAQRVPNLYRGHRKTNSDYQSIPARLYSKLKSVVYGS